MIELGVIEIREKILSNELTSEQITKAYIDEIKKSKINAVIEIFDDAIDSAKLMDEKIRHGYRGKLAGVPILLKDNILVKGKHCSAGSLFLKDYVAEYTSTVAQKLIDEGAIILGRTNMDEFAMGSGTETSYYGKTLNPHDNTRVPGGSSGGSAAAVAANLCAAALGTDTGGSIRQPSSYCGVVGIKPTYGRVSRYGVIAFASSLDQVGPITKNIEDNALLLEVLSGQDNHDETSANEPIVEYLKDQINSIAGLRVGVIPSVENMLKGLESEKLYNLAKQFLTDNGAKIVNLDINNMELVLPIYYIIAPAEATSNLARFDGVKYSRRSEKAKNIDEIYKYSRTEGFGDEVKRRIMLGNYVLSSGYFDAYYNKARSLQAKLRDEFLSAFKDCDIILMPTAKGEAFKLGSKTDPVDAYKEDIFTVSANITGLPSISIPFGSGSTGLPIGMQLLAPHFKEKELYQIAKFIERNKEIK
ncbi:MAG TPA: Asp-tRNA(Asn)/Glu-tRNA(Gln) amidotransferase subunit GatA [Candidatus Onthoplasma faecigallinarum]|nr:Asp-tRNA(Asn)/Glu-tRNA(Gln) amidotransferase subunit GatA [Candidatus Onthoplasma faecigallinarum]